MFDFANYMDEKCADENDYVERYKQDMMDCARLVANGELFYIAELESAIKKYQNAKSESYIYNRIRNTYNRRMNQDK